MFLPFPKEKKRNKFADEDSFFHAKLKMRSPSKPTVCEITFPQKPRETNEKHLEECFSIGFERYFWEGIGRKTRFQKLKTIAF